MTATSTPDIVGPVQFEAERRGLRLEHTSDWCRRKLDGGYCRRCTDTVRFLDCTEVSGCGMIAIDRELQNVETELTTVLKEEQQIIESNSRQSKQADRVYVTGTRTLAEWIRNTDR